MPKGVVTPRVVQCRACGGDFRTDRAGKAAWFCSREECKEKRDLDRRERLSTERRAPDAPPRQPPKTGPLAEDLAVVLRLADHYGANPRVLREAVQAVARGKGDMRYEYRRVAAVALALAAYIGGHTV